MCGIAGFIDFNNQKQFSFALLKKMIYKISHRGPDGFGFLWVQNNTGQLLRNEKVIFNVGNIAPNKTLGLAHTRLSINDHSEEALQPLYNEDKTCFVIHNGEIYNYRQLQGYLKQKGYRFRTQCDSEILLYLYEEYGIQGFNKIIGPNAFVLWDSKKQQSILYRDKYCERPLFYSFVNGVLLFGSELKVFKEIDNFNFSINPQALQSYLIYGNVIPPFSWFKNIHKMGPGSILIFNEKKIEKLAVSFPCYQRENDDFEFYLKEYDRLFARVVKDTIETTDCDIECCIALSGGIDSSLTTLYANDTNARFKKFSLFGSSEKQQEERERAKLIHQKTDGDHFICHSKNRIHNNFFDLALKIDEPIATLHDVEIRDTLYSEAGKYSKVLITSGFGDYSFLCGNTYADANRFDQKILNLKKYKNFIPAFMYQDNMLYKLYFNGFDPKIFGKWFHYQQAKQYEGYFKDSFSESIGDQIGDLLLKLNPPDAVNTMTVLRQAIVRHHIVYLDDLVGLRCGLELRDPFADERIRQFVSKIPLTHLSPLLNTGNYITSSPYWKHFLREALKFKGGLKIKSVYEGRKMPFGQGKDKIEHDKMTLLQNGSIFDLSHCKYFHSLPNLDFDAIIRMWNKWQLDKDKFKSHSLFLHRLVSLLIWLKAHDEEDVSYENEQLVCQ